MIILYFKSEDQDKTVKELAKKHNLQLIEITKNFYKSYKTINPEYIIIDESLKNNSQLKKIEKKYPKENIFSLNKDYKSYKNVSELIIFFQNVQNENFFIFNHPDYKNIIFGKFKSIKNSNRIKLDCEDNTIISTIAKDTKIKNFTILKNKKKEKKEMRIISSTEVELLR